MLTKEKTMCYKIMIGRVSGTWTWNPMTSMLYVLLESIDLTLLKFTMWVYTRLYNTYRVLIRHAGSISCLSMDTHIYTHACMHVCACARTHTHTHTHTHMDTDFPCKSNFKKPNAYWPLASSYLVIKELLDRIIGKLKAYFASPCIRVIQLNYWWLLKLAEEIMTSSKICTVKNYIVSDRRCHIQGKYSWY